MPMIGTRNLYGKVEMYAGRYHPPIKTRGWIHRDVR